MAIQQSVPLWADAKLSGELPSLRKRGEGQELEYKREFPQQSHELGQKIAAFASSGRGLILIGVANDGSLVGFDANDTEAHDRLIQRARGIINSVKPTVKAQPLLGFENNKAILAIEIDAQDEPVFYYDYRPYIRDGRESRPATPDEVKELVWKHPSSEFKRAVEQQQIRQMEDIQNAGRNFLEIMGEGRSLHQQRLYGGK